MHNTQRNPLNPVLGYVLTALLLSTPLAQAAQTDDAISTIAQGKAIAWDRKGGNCLACHSMPGGVSPGNIGPPLIAMQARFPKRQALYEQIYDATQINPDSRMPPFGKHQILTKTDINAVVDYLYTL